MRRRDANPIFYFAVAAAALAMAVCQANDGDSTEPVPAPVSAERSIARAQGSVGFDHRLDGVVLVAPQVAP